MRSDAFRAAAEAKDFSQVEEILAPDVTFRSPAVFSPYEGIEAVQALLGHVVKVFEDFRYVDQIEGEESAMLMFEARVGNREMQGVDILRFGSDGLVTELIVMIRPLSGLIAVAEAMQQRLQAAGGPQG